MTAEAPEIDAHALLAPLLREGIGAVRAAAARILASTAADAHDAEAVHDFRVAIRRLRTALRPAREIYGKKKLGVIAAELGAVARASGALRDEEVLHETLASLALEPGRRAAVDTWLARRKPQERVRRKRLAKLIRGEGHAGLPSLASALSALEKRIGKEIEAPSAASFAAGSLALAERGVAGRLDAGADDVIALHELRIRFKRLRYTVELLPEFFGPRGQALLKAATRMQKRLGEVHDFDEALGRVARSRSLTAPDRKVIAAALRAARATKVARALEERSAWTPTTA